MTIRNTVAENIGSQSYLSYAEPVVTALQAREDQIKEGLREFAEGKGLSSQEVTNLFVQVGLEQPAPTPEPVNAEGESDVAALLREVRALNQRLDSASQQAARHGIRF